MKKYLAIIAVAIITAFGMVSCTTVEPEAGQEAVLVDKPVFFGDGGVREYTIPTGRQYTWISTDYTYFSIIPIKYNEVLDNVFSNDNVPLDFDTNIIIEIRKGESWKIFKNYGVDWYKNNIEEEYRNTTRNYISRYSTFDLTSNRETLAEIDSKVKAHMIAYVKSLSKDNGDLPINIVQVITGCAKPNAPQLAEMDKTAAQIQAKQTQDRALEMQTARERAEKQRAIADKAYMNEMGLSTGQFIQMKYIEMIANKSGANIDVLVGGGETPMWNIRR